jgi:aspartyl-tRNA(Asn)/glutamyl-tRNA(Gln) amidotransferase subunit A
MARRVVDLARVYAVIAGPDPDDPTSAPEAPPDVLGTLGAGIEGVRILVPSGWIAAEADPEVARAVQAAVEVLAACGARIEEDELPGVDHAQTHLMPIIYADAAAYHRERLERAPERFGQDVLTRLQPGLALSATDYATSLRWLESWRREVERLFANRCDVVLTPTVPCTAPKIGTGDDVIATTARLTRFTWPWPAARVPALSVPCGFDAQGLPIGMQLAGARWSEPLLLRLGHTYQAATDWHLRRPPLDDRGATRPTRTGTT